jgi:hypothetical protein
MFRNQYIVVPDNPKPPFLDMSVLDFNDLHICAHPCLNVSIARRPSTELALLGYAIDPLHPYLTNDDIVSRLADTCGTLADLFAEIQILSGRYVVLYRNDSCFVAVGDACHLRQIYFGIIDGDLILTSSPKLLLTYLHCDLQMSRDKRAFVETPAFAKQESAWYGDRSLDDRLYKLLPNHYLDLKSQEVRRMPPLPLHECSNEEQVMDYVSSVLQGTYSCLSERYRLIQALTAGWDSRVLLSAGRKMKDQIRFYVFAPSGEEPPDVWVPRNLSGRLGLNFTVIRPEALRDDFLTDYREEHVIPRVLPKTAHIQYHYDRHYTQDVVNVNGNAAEIARCFYGHTTRRVTLDMLLVFSGYGHTVDFVKTEIEKWYDDARQYAQDSGIPLLDLFYWEQRMGNWGALAPFEQDIAVEEISPFNNRSLLGSLLRVDPKRRRSPDYRFFRRLVQHLWADALSEEVNPGAPHMKQVIKGSSTMKYYALKLSGILKHAR